MRVKVLSWNCRGLSNKLDNLELITDHDVIFIYEAWTDEDSDVRVKGYRHWNFCRKYRHPRAKKNSGGVVLYVRKTLVAGIEVVRHDYDTIIWIKLDNVFFKLQKDIYICGLYMWKERSPMNEHITNSSELLVTLRKGINQYNEIGNVFIVGDFNGRIGREREDRPMERYLRDPTPRSIIPGRTRQDKTSNRQGRRLCTLCIDHSLIVANGRVGTDYKTGDFTCKNVNGDSIIDYLLIPERAFSHVTSFDLLDFNGSDHRPLSFKIKYPKKRNTDQPGTHVDQV